MATTNNNSIFTCCKRFTVLAGPSPVIPRRSVSELRERGVPWYGRLIAVMLGYAPSELTRARLKITSTTTWLMPFLLALSTRGWFENVQRPEPPAPHAFKAYYKPPIPEGYDEWALHPMYTWWTRFEWAKWRTEAIITYTSILMLGTQLISFKSLVIVTSLLIYYDGDMFDVPCPVTTFEWAVRAHFTHYIPHVNASYIDIYDASCKEVDYVMDWFKLFRYAALALCILWYMFRTMLSFRIDDPLPIRSYQWLRSAVRNISIFKPKRITNNHSHPIAAAFRNAADDTVNHFIKQMGFVPYSIQLSARDIKKNVVGALKHNIGFHTDFHAPEGCALLEDHHILKMINVDYYVNWSEYLWMFKPVVMFTFTPSRPVGVHQETRWTITPEGKTRMTVAGGMTYEHHIWDYNCDSVQADYPGISLIYSVESVSIDEHWSIVMLCPKHIIANETQHTSHTLKRREYLRTGMTLCGKDKTIAILADAATGVTHYAQPDQYSCVSVSVRLSAMITARICSKPLALHDLLNFMISEYPNHDQIAHAQALVWSLFPVDDYKPPLYTIQEARDQSVHYRRAPTTLVLEEKNKWTGVLLCNPIIPSGYLPTMNRANDEWCIDKRINAIHNDQITFPEEYKRYMDEFIELLVPIPHLYHPKSVTEVVDGQTRPTQRAGNLKVMAELPSWLSAQRVTDRKSIRQWRMIIKSISKKEVYPSIKDPRNISTTPTEHCLLYSTFTQVVCELLKKFDWYGFKHPDVVARRIHDLALRSETFVETDFSRFDGTHSHALYALEFAIMRRMFHPDHHPMIQLLQEAMSTAKARTLYGVKYDVDGSRVSGAADTSVGNTEDNAFVGFCTYRKQHYSPADAFKKLGIYAGDDGISPDAEPAVIEKVTNDLKLKLKATRRKTNTKTTFLARIYPNPMASPMNCMDPMRQLSKIHLYPSRAITDPLLLPQLLYNRCMSFSYTDPHLPLLSDFCAYVDRICPDNLKEVIPSFMSYSIQEWGEVREYALDEDSGMAVICSELGLQQHDILTYCQYLRTDPPFFQLRSILDYQHVEHPATNITLGDEHALTQPRDQNPTGLSPLMHGPPGDYHACPDPERNLACNGNCNHSPRTNLIVPLDEAPNISKLYMATQDADFPCIEQAIREVDDSKMPDVYETCCFTGGDTKRLVNAGMRVHANDIDPQAVERARLLCANEIAAAAALIDVRDTSDVKHGPPVHGSTVYIDPPWKYGKRYKEYPEQMPELSGTPITHIVSQYLLKNALGVVMKLPYTYDFDEHYKVLPEMLYRTTIFNHMVPRTMRTNPGLRCKFLVVTVQRNKPGDSIGPVVTPLPPPQLQVVIEPQQPAKIPRFATPPKGKVKRPKIKIGSHASARRRQAKEAVELKTLVA